VALSADGRTAATLTEIFSTAQETGLVTVYSPQGVRSVRIPLGSAGATVSLSADGRLLAVAGAALPNSVLVIRTSNLSTAFATAGSAASFSSSGALLAVERPDLTIALLRTDDWRTQTALYGENYPQVNIAFSPDDRLVAVMDEDDVLRTWDTDDGTLLNTRYVIEGVFPGRLLTPQPVLTAAGLALIGVDATDSLDAFSVCDACLDPSAVLKQATERLEEISPVSSG
jgi:WD40 repeat protein